MGRDRASISPAERLGAAVDCASKRRALFKLCFRGFVLYIVDKVPPSMLWDDGSRKAKKISGKDSSGITPAILIQTAPTRP